MELINIGSGSKGNATLIYNEDTILLIDCGLSKRKINKALKSINKNIDDIDFVLFTHSHNDHIGNHELFDKDKKYALEGIIDLLDDHKLEFEKEYNFKSFKIILLKTSHDAYPSSGFLIKDNNEELVYITDTGIIPYSTLFLIKNKTYYFIESNYDNKLLINSNRSLELINRILGIKGHLSNEESAYYMLNSVGINTKKIILAHISEECNDINIMLDTYNNIFNKNNIYKDIIIDYATQKEEKKLI